MSKVILYNPKEKTRLRVPYLPFSLMTVGSELKRQGVEVVIVDGRIEKNPRPIIRRHLKDPELVFFGVTLITGSVILDALSTAAWVRREAPQAKVVFGGVHASLLPKETVQNPFVDIVVIGPGEEIAVRLAQCLIRKESLESVSGIAYKCGGGVKINPPEPVTDVTGGEGIDYGMVGMRSYMKRDATGDRCVDYLSSRGCPHPCTYCAISQLWKRKMLFYSPQKMADSISGFVRDYGIDSIHFLDDNFFVDRRRVESFADEIIARGVRIHIWSMCRIEYFAKFEESFLEKLKKAGFHTLNFGAESGAQKILDKLKKGIRVEEILTAARRCHEFGFRGQFSFMMGFPFESEEDLEKTMSLMDQIHEIDPSFDLQLFPYIPFPETELARECEAFGYRPPETLEAWARFEFGSVSMPWLDKKMKTRMDTLPTIAWFAFTSETAIKLGGILGFAFRALGHLARWRWKKRFFDYAWEWKLINAMAKK